MPYNWSGPGDGMWMIGGLLFLIAVIVLVVWVVNTLTRGDRTARGSADPSRATPTDILRERFARGEITEEQFEQAKKALGRDG